MKEEQIHYNYYFWGPLLFKATVNDVDLKKLKKICKKRKDWDYRHNLAGVIDNEYKIDRKEFINIVNRYISAYAQGDIVTIAGCTTSTGNNGVFEISHIDNTNDIT